MINSLKKELRVLATPEKAKASAWFFKTGPGQYGEGDKFLGVTVPEQRIIAKKYKDLNLVEIEKLLHSEFHEERLIALFALVGQFQNSEETGRKNIFELYLRNIKWVNNWDLVDSSAHKIIGEYIKNKKTTLLLVLAKSQDLWERRIAIISTFAFLAEGNPRPTYLVADLLLDDREDLIQKAVGWVLREAGKKVSESELESYLQKNYKRLGRTTLRYAIEKFDLEKRKSYLKGVF